MIKEYILTITVIIIQYFLNKFETSDEMHNGQ